MPHNFVYKKGFSSGWSILSAKSWFKLTAFFSKREQARRRALTAVNAVVLGTTTPTTRRLPAGTTTTRTTATTTMASALFAPRSSPFIFAYAQNHIGKTEECRANALSVADANYFTRYDGAGSLKEYKRTLHHIFLKVIVFSENGRKSAAEKRMERLVNTHKCEKCVVSTRFYSESI